MQSKEPYMLNPQILGQLLIMQSMVINLPDEKSIFSFVCRGLTDMPGVAQVRHAASPPETMDKSTVRFPFLRGETYWGELLLTVSDPIAFEPYEEYLNNFCFMVAVILEERHLNESHQAKLEQRVQERTTDLVEANRLLDSEIEERKRIEEELQQKNRDLETIASIISSTTTDLNLQAILDKALKAAIKLTGMEGGTLCLVDRDTETLLLSAWHNASPEMIADLSAQAVKMGDCLCGDAARTGKSLILWDNASGCEYATFEAVRNEGIRFHGAFPLMARGSATGVLCIFSRTPSKPSLHSIKLVEDLCGPIALAIENARLFEAVQKELLERRRVELELRHQAQIIDQVHDAVISLDLTGFVLSWNRGAERLFGYSAGEAVGRHIAFVYPEDRLDRIENENIRRLLDKGEHEVEVLNRKKSGEHVYIHLSLSLLSDDSGAISGVVGVAMDVTQRKNAEEKLKRSKALLQKVFDGISEPLILFGKDGLVKMLNKATREHYNLSGEETAIGKHCFEGFRGHTEPCEGCSRPFSEIKGFTGVFVRERVKSPGGVEQVAVYSVTDEQGEEDGTVIRIRDITEAKLMERQSIQNEKLASIGLLASGIAHEINNPNNFITFNIPILRDYMGELMPIFSKYCVAHPGFEIFGMSFPTFQQDMSRLLDNMEHGASRITATVSRLKNFVSKHNDGAHRLIDLKQVAEQAIEICRTEIRKRAKSFEVDIAQDLSPILTDPIAIEQVFVNLLINASHASDKEDSWIHLKIRSSRRASEHSIIEVIDNGCGMEKAVREKIFDPFFTTKGHMQGTGLGLYVCHNLIAGLGGRIEVESELGKGSTFRVVLREGP